MSSPKHAFVPVGTLADYEGTPATIRRDYDTLVIPAMTIPLDQLPVLRGILDDAEPDMIGCQQEMAEIAAAELPEGACAHCGGHITLLGGSWTCDEGTIACPASPDKTAAYAPHKPKEN